MTMRGFTDRFGLPPEGFPQVIDMQLNSGTWEQMDEIKKTTDEILEEKLRSIIGKKTDYPWFYGKIKGEA